MRRKAPTDRLAHQLAADEIHRPAQEGRRLGLSGAMRAAFEQG